MNTSSLKILFEKGQACRTCLKVPEMNGSRFLQGMVVADHLVSNPPDRYWSESRVCSPRPPYLSKIFFPPPPDPSTSCARLFSSPCCVRSCQILLVVVNYASGDFDVKWSFLGTCLAWKGIRCHGCVLR